MWARGLGGGSFLAYTFTFHYPHNPTHLFMCAHSFVYIRYFVIGALGGSAIRLEKRSRATTSRQRWRRGRPLRTKSATTVKGARPNSTQTINWKGLSSVGEILTHARDILSQSSEQCCHCPDSSSCFLRSIAEKCGSSEIFRNNVGFFAALVLSEHRQEQQQTLFIYIHWLLRHLLLVIVNKQFKYLLRFLFLTEKYVIFWLC